MRKKNLAIIISAITASTALLSSHALSTVNSYNKPVSSSNIEGFAIEGAGGSSNTMLSSRSATTTDKNTLSQVSSTTMNGDTYVRYQQKYEGIPVIGKQVVVKQPKAVTGFAATSRSALRATATRISLAKDLDVDLVATVSAGDAMAFAKQQFEQSYSGTQVADGSNSVKATKEIRIVDNKARLYYRVTFNASNTAGGKPYSMVYIIAANGGAKPVVLKHWDNIQNYEDTGPGGNEKTVKHGPTGVEFFYGENNLPALNVSENNGSCTMDNGDVRLVDVQNQEDHSWDSDYNTTAYQYSCGHNQGDPINGAYSPTDDAYYFGSMIIDMYKNWYGVDALQENGEPMQLIMRVHYGTDYDNAFWDGQTMSFGDGSSFYPLVSLDVAGHEVSHGFTEQHSGLEYSDQSGSLNEAFSDMAGQAVRAYLLSTNSDLYKQLYFNQDEVTWGIGETIMKGDNTDTALRYMDQPSKDQDENGVSADCLDKDLAGSGCIISYDDVVTAAKKLPLRYQQSYIVHHGSGVFNKAFYLLSQQVGIKEAFKVMKDANATRWTSGSDFADAACGVLQAAHADGVGSDSMIKEVFNQVGVAIVDEDCSTK
ncbi:Hemagglutinin/proteinase precursor [Piscirickettsia salmonis]|uniref:M4 family metallopeptidase n=1 Tax=Piscirickettsia salmonis TaxID=1238 RepID=UPI0012B7560B|nr:M4 family metallopeptidase [Piscirickettsia salmonis]QGO65130.1 Hemagglutinin/proteinase precursor [Piscirickettsia salmonis]